MLNYFWFQSFVSDPGKWDPILDQFSMITRPSTRPNGLKTIPSPAAHTRLANIWEYPSPSRFSPYTMSSPLLSKTLNPPMTEKNYTVYAISRQPIWYNNALRMQENSLESTEIFKIFRGSIPPYHPSVSRLRRSLFRSKHFMSPNPLQWNPATGL